MRVVLEHCRKDRWCDVLRMVREDPVVGLYHMVMNNRVPTTILHQAITSRSRIEPREKVIRQILMKTPQAAAMGNAFGSLPLHVVAQRNTHMDVESKTRIIVDLVQAYPDALTIAGGKGKRNPLHVLFTGTSCYENVPAHFFHIGVFFSFVNKWH